MCKREVFPLNDTIVPPVSVDAGQCRQRLTALAEHLPQHLADEGIGMVPMMLDRCDPDDESAAVIGKLRSDHGHVVVDAAEIVVMIQEKRQ
ncbi:MAG: hypothetical protein JKY00_04925 [Roseicyclus sp.]|nr:hypothetical protein [Roseicyclus sp.]